MPYQSEQGRFYYGYSIGVLMMDALIPRPPGDVGNASSFNFPILYKKVESASLEKLIQKKDPALLEPFISCANDLIKQGVKAITTTCGFMILFQKQLAQELSCPVFTSSLLQLPFIMACLAEEQKVGVITADNKNLDQKMLNLACNDTSRVVTKGMQEKPFFKKGILDQGGELYFKKVQQEAVAASEELVRENPKVGAILLECANLPPYAKAIQKAVDLPVFDFTTMINHIFLSIHRHSFKGYY